MARRKKSNGKKRNNFALARIGLLCNAASELGFGEAGNLAKQGDFRGAVNAVSGRFTFAQLAEIEAKGVAVQAIKNNLGSIPLYTGRKTSVTIN